MPPTPKSLLKNSGNGEMSPQERWQQNELIGNAIMSRQQLISKFMDPRRDIDDECGYPKDITSETYQLLYDRESIATRVVEILSKESWGVQPKVFESEDPEEETDFEIAWENIRKNLRGDSFFQDREGDPVWELLRRADILSGIGHFGILLLGIDDGKSLSEPVDGIDEQGLIRGLKNGKKKKKGKPKEEQTTNLRRRRRFSQPSRQEEENPKEDIPGEKDDQGNGTDDADNVILSKKEEKETEEPTREVKTKYKLLYLRAFPESLVQITRYETDKKNRRYGLPTRYLITLNDPDDQYSGVGLPQSTEEVHWTRVVHLADNLGSSEIFGVPRMRPVFNRLYDLRKLYGGSAEMYWRGAFPGLSFETHPQLGGDVDIDYDLVKSAAENYMNTLQRYLAVEGMSVKTLSPQVVDPSAQIDTQITAICIELGIPKRKFMGSERGELASGQDDGDWNDVLQSRQNGYITPRIIVPFVDRLIAVGVLPQPEGYSLEWPDIKAVTEQEQAQLAVTKTDALTKYIGGQVDTLISPMDYLTRIVGFEDEEAEQILESTLEHMEEAFPESEGDLVPGRAPQEPQQPMMGPDGQPVAPDGQPFPPGFGDEDEEDDSDGGGFDGGGGFPSKKPKPKSKFPFNQGPTVNRLDLIFQNVADEYGLTPHEYEEVKRRYVAQLTENHTPGGVEHRQQDHGRKKKRWADWSKTDEVSVVRDVDGDIKVEFSLEKSPDRVFEVTFGRDSQGMYYTNLYDEDHRQGQTGRGDAMEIMRKTSQSIAKVIKEKNPNGFDFSGASYKHDKLYKAFIKKISAVFSDYIGASINDNFYIIKENFLNEFKRDLTSREQEHLAVYNCGQLTYNEFYRGLLAESVLTAHHQGPGSHPSGSPQKVHSVKDGERKWQEANKTGVPAAADTAIAAKKKEKKGKKENRWQDWLSKDQGAWKTSGSESKSSFEKNGTHFDLTIDELSTEEGGLALGDLVKSPDVKGGAKSGQFEKIEKLLGKHKSYGFTFSATDLASGEKTLKATGKQKGRAVSIFRNVGKRLNEFINEKKPGAVYFSANKNEPSRVDLYDFFARRAKNLYPDYVGANLDGRDNGFFALYRKDVAEGLGLKKLTAGVPGYKVYNEWSPIPKDNPVLNELETWLVANHQGGTSGTEPHSGTGSLQDVHRGGQQKAEEKPPRQESRAERRRRRFSDWISPDEDLNPWEPSSRYDSDDDVEIPDEARTDWIDNNREEAWTEVSEELWDDIEDDVLGGMYNNDNFDAAEEKREFLRSMAEELGIDPDSIGREQFANSGLTVAYRRRRSFGRTVDTDLLRFTDTDEPNDVAWRNVQGKFEDAWENHVKNDLRDDISYETWWDDQVGDNVYENLDDRWHRLTNSEQAEYARSAGYLDDDDERPGSENSVNAYQNFRTSYTVKGRTYNASISNYSDFPHSVETYIQEVSDRPMYSFVFTDPAGSTRLTGRTGSVRESMTVMKRTSQQIAAAVRRFDPSIVTFSGARVPKKNDPEGGRVGLYRFLTERTKDLFPGYVGVERPGGSSHTFALIKEDVLAHLQRKASSHFENVIVYNIANKKPRRTVGRYDSKFWDQLYAELIRPEIRRIEDEYDAVMKARRPSERRKPVKNDDLTLQHEGRPEPTDPHASGSPQSKHAGEQGATQTKSQSRGERIRRRFADWIKPSKDVKPWKGRDQSAGSYRDRHDPVREINDDWQGSRDEENARLSYEDDRYNDIHTDYEYEEIQELREMYDTETDDLLDIDDADGVFEERARENLEGEYEDDEIPEDILEEETQRERENAREYRDSERADWVNSELEDRSDSIHERVYETIASEWRDMDEAEQVEFAEETGGIDVSEYIIEPEEDEDTLTGVEDSSDTVNPNQTFNSSFEVNGREYRTALLNGNSGDIPGITIAAGNSPYYEFRFRDDRGDYNMTGKTEGVTEAKEIMKKTAQHVASAISRFNPASIYFSAEREERHRYATGREDEEGGRVGFYRFMTKRTKDLYPGYTGVEVPHTSSHSFYLVRDDVLKKIRDTHSARLDRERAIIYNQRGKPASDSSEDQKTFKSVNELFSHGYMPEKFWEDLIRELIKPEAIARDNKDRLSKKLKS